MNAISTLDQIIARATQNAVSNDGDYLGEDGLLYCSKCHTPKQCRIEFELQGQKIIRTPPTPCRCEKERIEKEEQEEQQRQKMQSLDRLRSSSLMDGRFADSTFEGYRTTQDNERQYKIARRYVHGFKEMLSKNQGLLFYGDPGTGKTFLAACIANALMEKTIPVVMTSFVKLLSFSKVDDEEETIRRINESELLIIDDLGAERGTDYALERVYNIIDSRYRANKPLILTTNLDLRDITSVQDIKYQRIYDRILESCYPVQFTGPSWRKQEAASRYEDMKAFLEG